MYTVAAFVLVGLALFGASRGNNADRALYDREPDNRLLILHIRQDLKLVAFLLGAVGILIGLTADHIF